MYESHIVFQFFREWGFSDGHAAAMNRLSGRGKTVSMLGNMQNKFDLFFGDVAITNSYRFQLIEFKQDSEGFAKEVTAAKEKRSKLYQHLSTDQVCLEISYRAHVAGYVEKDVLRLDPYYLIASKLSKENFREKAEWKYFHDFDSYYAKWNGSSSLEQMGLDAAGFKTYIDCMYQHLQTGGEGMLLIYSAKKKQLVPFYGSTQKMIMELRNSFAKLGNVKLKDEQRRDSLSDGTLPPAAQRAKKARKFVKNVGAPGVEKKS